MPCHTVVEITLDDTAINREARKNLGLPEEGTITVETVRESTVDSVKNLGLRAVRLKIEKEVAALRVFEEVQLLDPTAIMIREGDEIRITVNR